MYRSLPTGSKIEATPAQIASLHVSLNSSPISVDNGPLLQARAYVVGVANPDTSFTVYVVLVSDGGPYSLFVSNPLKFLRDHYSPIEVEALDLVEGHGFVMDRVDVNDADEVRDIASDLPFGAPLVESSPPQTFVPAVQRPATPAPPPPPAYVDMVPPPPALTVDQYPAPPLTVDQYPAPPLTVEQYSPPPMPMGQQYPSPPRRPGGPTSDPGSASAVRRMPSRSLEPTAGNTTTHGTPISALAGGELGMPPEEAIALLGRLMVLF
jgi:hypothetical protein